jgi:hypothetical protein
MESPGARKGHAGTIGGINPLATTGRERNGPLPYPLVAESCTVSTGTFVEPIEVWNCSALLHFRVYFYHDCLPSLALRTLHFNVQIWRALG